MPVHKDGLGFLVADVYRLMRRAFLQQIEQGALTLAQSRALVYISRHEGLRQVELAELLDLQPITVGRLVDQLAALGLVERRADPADRRANRIHLQAAAGPHLEAFADVIDRVHAHALADLDAAQTRRLLESLSQVRSTLSAPAPLPGERKGARLDG
jgi:DNA-binding MarR family transcriptional regulator